MNDIQFNILQQNYDSDPLIMHGLYQGVIGGPNIRKSACAGKHVYNALIENALEFVNSNRGTESKNGRTLRVSEYDQRSAEHFAGFDKDLTKYLLIYLEGEERRDLQEASRIKPDSQVCVD